MKLWRSASTGAPLARLARREVRLARWEVRHGRFQRSMELVTAIAALASGVEAYLQHLRGAYTHWLMWTPVWLTPAVILTSFASVWSRRVAHLLLPIVSVVSLVDGVVGFVYHIKGIRALSGGFRLGRYNVVMGPPIFAPLLVCITGVLGLLAALLRPEAWPRDGARTAGLVRSVRGEPGRRASTFASDVAQGRFQQVMAVIAAAFAVLAGGESYFEHLRGSFNQRVMWTPVWLTPPMTVAGIGAARSPTVARRVLPLVSVATFADGLLGFVLHLRGLEREPGGLESLRYALIAGPPLFAPLLFCAVGLLGFIAALLRREGTGA